MAPLAERTGATIAQLALRWALEQQGVTAVIAGSRNLEHTRSNAASGSIQLSADGRSQLDELFSSVG
jgi:aryl-alcohol dehydrogenase-like predicted oxidoreductase